MGKKKESKDRLILARFCQQGKESLIDLEKAILLLEVHPEDLKLISAVLSEVHRLKGRASFLGIPELMRFCHELELTFLALKEKRLQCTAELIDALLPVVEESKIIVEELDKRIAGGSKQKAEFSGPDFECPGDYDEETALQNLKAVRTILLHIQEENIKKTMEDDLVSAQVSEEQNLMAEAGQNSKADLIKRFQLEIVENLETMENNLLVRLDREGTDLRALQELLRAVNGLKEGVERYLTAQPLISPSYSGLLYFSEVIHSWESLLTYSRDNKLGINKTLLNLCYRVVDFGKEILQRVLLEDWSQPLEQGLLEELQAYGEKILPSQQEQGVSPESLPQDQIPGRQELCQRSNEQSQGSKEEGVGQPHLQPGLTQSIRVNQEKLDQMMNMISELVIAKNSFMHLATKINTEYHLPEIGKEVKQVGAYVNRISEDLQNAIMSIRMVEIKYIFQKMPRVVRDIAQATGKKMELVMEGENTEIDKMIVEQISDPLIHLIRNAADHGIETREQRLVKGKPEQGRITLRAYNRNKQVYIEVEDDGKGMDVQEIKEKALSKGFITQEEAERMSPKQLLNIIFYPGFSTASKITEVSGRGVGMDIVKSNIAKIKGTISVESKVDVGTKMTIQLPLTLAVSRGLIVEAKGESYIFPLEYIAETVKIAPQAIHEHEGRCFTHMRGEVLGVEWLSKVFRLGERKLAKEELNAVIITNGQEKCALVVDKFKGEQEFVVKTLEGSLANIPGIAGSTILGNGKVILIVNPLELYKLLEVRTGAGAGYE